MFDRVLNTVSLAQFRHKNYLFLFWVHSRPETLTPLPLAQFRHKNILFAFWVYSRPGTLQKLTY